MPRNEGLDRMQRMWDTWRENIKCGNKLSDVICHPKLLPKQRRRRKQKEAQEKMGDALIGIKLLVNIPSSKRRSSSSFEELDVGYQSRKVIEMILAAYLRGPIEKLSKIRKVLKVKNSLKVIDKFEKHREMVKQKAKEREQKNPRSLVDGNELLCFYVTTMACHGRHSRWVSGTCQDPRCSVCKTVGFSYSSDNSRCRVKVCMTSEALSESFPQVLKGKNVQRAVIMCRIIAGSTTSVDDKISEDGYDSVWKKGFCPNSEYLILDNPNAVLPCFIIVFNYVCFLR